MKITTADAFTDTPFSGNPAAVCILEKPADEGWMQSVANEMNLAETAFLHPEADGYRLRWFTPAAEVDLCGHATLASAHVLWEEGRLPADAVARFHTRSGLLTAARDGEWIVLDFPALASTETAPPDGLADALGEEPVRVFASRFDLLVELPSERTVRALRPDIGRIRALPVRGVIVTARAESQGFDFVSRFFAPALGVDEDPVTGSAHCALGPYWQALIGKSDFLAYQASPRGGILRVTVAGDRVRLGGRAVTVLRGALQPDP